MGLFNPAVIGGPLPGATAGSVLFAGAGGLFAQDNSHFFWDDTNYWLGVGTIPETALHVSFDIGGTVNPDTLLALDSISSNTVGDGFGGEILWRLQDAGGTLRNAALDTVQWRTAAAGTRKADRVFTVYDDTAAREALRLSTDGTVSYALLPNDPPVSTTLSRLAMGSPLSGGSAGGTFLGCNALAGYAGDLMHFQVNGTGTLRSFADGSLTIGSSADLYKLTLIGAAKNGVYHAVLATSPVANDVLFYGAVTGTVVGDIRAFDCSGSCQGNLTATFYNQLAHVDAHAVFDLQVLSGASGDPKLRFAIATAGVQCSLGIDNSDSDKLKFVNSHVLDGAVPGITMDRNNLVGINTAGPAVRFHVVHDSALTNTVDVVQQIDHNTSGTPAAGFGSELRLRLESSTTPDRAAAGLSWEWATATDASRKARGKLTAWDTAVRECIRWEADGANPMVGFLGTAAQGVQTVNAAAVDPATTMALTNQLRAALIGFGLCV